MTRKAAHRQEPADLANCTERVYDLLSIASGAEGSSGSDARLAAAILSVENGRECASDSPLEATLYVFQYEHEGSLAKWWTSRRDPRIIGADGGSARLRKAKCAAPEGVRALKHKAHVTNANWNRGCASRGYELLVSITRDMIAYVWRIGASKADCDLIFQVDIGENVFGPSASAFWVDMTSIGVDSIFTGQEFIIFHEVTDGTSRTKEVDNGGPCHAESIKSSGVQSKSEHAGRCSGGDCSVHKQHFKILALQGIHSPSGNVNGEFLISHQDIALPVVVQNIQCVQLCKHTLQTGLITLYSPDTMRPTKVHPANGFQASRWMTLVSRSINGEPCEEVVEGMLGNQIAIALHKFLPPCTIKGVSDLGLPVELLIAPGDIFLKDCSMQGTDNVIGLVVRYLCRAYSPLFIPRMAALDDISSNVNMEEAILSKLNAHVDVVEAESISDPGHFLALVLHRNGSVGLCRASHTNHALISYNKLQIPKVAHVNAMKVLKHNDRVLVAMFLVDSVGVTRCSIYCWNACKLTLDASWPFQLAPDKEKLIMEFGVWYEGGPLYLMTRCLLAGSNATSDNAVHIYLIKGADILHLSAIADNEIRDLFTGIVRKLPLEVRGARYSLRGGTLICSSQAQSTITLRLSTGAKVDGDSLVIYHPRYIKAFVDIGLRRFVDELVCGLVEVCRNFLVKLAEDNACGSTNTLHHPCDCLTTKVKHVQMFTDFDRTTSLRLLQTFSVLVNVDPANLGVEVGVNIPSVDITEGVAAKELLLYLEHMRLPGLIWQDQLELMQLIETQFQNSGAAKFIGNHASHQKPISRMDTLSNFLLMNEAKRYEDFNIDESIDFSLTSDDEKDEDPCDGDRSVSCPLIRKAQHLLQSGKEKEKVQMWRTNDELASLTCPSKILTDDFCIGRCVDYVKYGSDDEDHLVWAILFKDDHHLFSNMIALLDSGDDQELCNYLLQHMKSFGIGYWVRTPTCIEQFCSTLERGFRKLISVTDTGSSVDKFDDFGFWSILRGKPLVYGCVLKAKGFQKLGEFLSNNFSDEKWKQAAVKNAYALIAQKRYLLAAGFFLLADRVGDAVNVCFQYMDNAQLACLICKIRQHDIEDALRLMKPSKVKDILQCNMSSDCVINVDVNTVNDLVYYLYTGIRFKHISEDVMRDTIIRCADGYIDMGMPLMGILINSLNVTDGPNIWKPLVVQSNMQHLVKNDLDNCSLYQDCVQTMLRLCEENINNGDKGVSNNGSEIDNSSAMDASSAANGPANKHSDQSPLSSESNRDCDLELYQDGFYLYLIHLLNNLKGLYGLELTVGSVSGKASLNRNTFETVQHLPDYFSHLCKMCIAFFEGDAAIDGTFMLALMLRAIMEGRDSFSSCIILSVASLLSITCFDRGVNGQIYRAFMGQLVVLNNLLNNQGSGDQFLACLLRTIEPLCFGTPGKTLEPQLINVLHSIETPPKHAFFGICLGTAVLETLMGICRSWFYKFAEHAESAEQALMDRLLYSASKFLFYNVKSEVVEDALNSTGIVFPMLSLRIDLEKPVDCKVKDAECHVYDSFLEQYVASVYGTEFEKLWRLLHCGFRTASIFNRHMHPTYKNGYRSKGTCCRVTEMGEQPQAMTTESKALPLVMPMTAMFAPPQAWSQERVAAEAKLKERNKGDRKNTCEGEVTIFKVLRMLRFKTLHAFKGRLASPSYAMPSTTICEGAKGLTAKAIVGPVISDLHMMAMLNLRGPCTLSALPDELSQGALSEIFEAVNKSKPMPLHYSLYVKLMRIMTMYSKNRLEKKYAVKVSKFAALAEKFHKCFNARNNSKDPSLGGPSGGICGHPFWPIYAVVYGENPPKHMPAYNVSLQHPVTLMRTANTGLDSAGCASDRTIVYDCVTDMHLNRGKGSVFGDLCSVAWSADSLAVLDKSGWMLIYHLKQIMYVEDGDREIAIPSISFRAHTAATESTWLSDTYVATIGNGVLHDMVTPDVRVIDTRDGDVGCQNTSSLSNVSSPIIIDNTETSSPGSHPDHILRCVTDMHIPCLCIWDLVDFNKNNSPKLKVVIANSTNVPHSIFHKKKHASSAVRFTCVLPIPAMRLDSRNSNGLEYDMVVFDSMGDMMLFSAATSEITVTCHVHSCAVVKCFYVGGNIVTVTQDGAVAMFRLNGIFSEPTRIFEGVAQPRANSADTTTSDGFVTSISEYLGIKFVESPSREACTNKATLLPEIIDAQIIQNRFLVLTTADGNATVTELPC
ncbi:-DmX-like protein 2 [Babesia bigemina]|uniref:-DmX-like protein 2 n=1 Tax=Babesia bigemina TaxID=5866 RepID=A0A061DCU7_BABBI|nr:-DmX-like protein 2 [Babesia bigemina]CDR98012.1 -DmX-like protein 2 [Babesia bigemina]|eukprot:XP_012770198.1 -DmX-like protein 2 [Babesia bigemina]